MSPETRAVIRELLSRADGSGYDNAYPIATIAESLGLSEREIYDADSETGLLADLIRQGMLWTNDAGSAAGVAIETRELLAAWSREPLPSPTPAAPPSPKEPERPASLYYIQEAGSVVGNAALWWKPNSRGYTSNLDEAGKYSAQDAARLCSNPDRQDRAFRCDLVDALAHRTVSKLALSLEVLYPEPDDDGVVERVQESPAVEGEPDIRIHPAIEPRAETGPVQFGDDWPGAFIRGDRAGAAALAVRTALALPGLPVSARCELSGLLRTLTSCIPGPARAAFEDDGNAEADRILSLSDEELEAEIRAQGLDPAELAAAGRQAFERAVARLDAEEAAGELAEGQEPCPFCGDTRVRLEVYAETGKYFCRCPSCACEGPWGKSKTSAIGWWNRRLTARPKARPKVWTWDQVLALVATTAGWRIERFIEEFGQDGHALDRFLNYEEEKDQAIDDDDGPVEPAASDDGPESSFPPMHEQSGQKLFELTYSLEPERCRWTFTDGRRCAGPRGHDGDCRPGVGR